MINNSLEIWDIKENVLDGLPNSVATHAQVMQQFVNCGATLLYWFHGISSPSSTTVTTTRATPPISNPGATANSFPARHMDLSATALVVHLALPSRKISLTVRKGFEVGLFREAGAANKGVRYWPHCFCGVSFVFSSSSFSFFLLGFLFSPVFSSGPGC